MKLSIYTLGPSSVYTYYVTNPYVTNKLNELELTLCIQYARAALMFADVLKV